MAAGLDEQVRPLSTNRAADDTSIGMEARVAALEAHFGHIKDDVAEIRKDIRELRSDAKIEFRIVFGALITVALGLAALMAKGFHWF